MNWTYIIIYSRDTIMKEAILRDPGQPKTENKYKEKLKEIHRKA